MQQSIYILILLYLLTSCNVKPGRSDQSVVISAVLDSLANSYEMPAGILVYNPENATFYTNDSNYAKLRTLPASTFKIPNTIVGIETGVIDKDTTVFRWDGIERVVPQWNADLTLQEAFSYSCVPCYQNMAREIGAEKMAVMLNSLEYPGMVVDSSTIDQFWLMGESKINLFEQIDFVRRLQEEKLPISPTTTKAMLKLMTVPDTTAEYTLRAKTGWTYQDKKNICWFVGSIESKAGLHYFAIRITPDINIESTIFLPLRQQLTLQALKKLNIIR